MPAACLGGRPPPIPNSAPTTASKLPAQHQCVTGRNTEHWWYSKILWMPWENKLATLSFSGTSTWSLLSLPGNPGILTTDSPPKQLNVTSRLCPSPSQRSTWARIDTDHRKPPPEQFRQQGGNEKWGFCQLQTCLEGLQFVERQHLPCSARIPPNLPAWLGTRGQWLFLSWNTLALAHGLYELKILKCRFLKCRRGTRGVLWMQHEFFSVRLIVLDVPGRKKVK